MKSAYSDFCREVNELQIGCSNWVGTRKGQHPLMNTLQWHYHNAYAFLLRKKLLTSSLSYQFKLPRYQFV